MPDGTHVAPATATRLVLEWELGAGRLTWSAGGASGTLPLVKAAHEGAASYLWIRAGAAGAGFCMRTISFTAAHSAAVAMKHDDRPSTLEVAAVDGSVSVSVDAASGVVSTITARGTVHVVAASTSMSDARTLSVSVASQPDGSVLVSRLVCAEPGPDLCARRALVQEAYEPRSDSVGWTINASSPEAGVGEGSTPLWSAPLLTNVSFAEAGDLQLWMPWERSGNPQCCSSRNFTNALKPSDGGFSWWSDQFLLGALVVPGRGAAPPATPGDHDWIIHDMASVLQPGSDSGVSFIASPKNPTAHPTWLNTSGPAARGGLRCETSGVCKGPASFSLARENLRFGDGAVPHVFDADIVAHAADWREALAYSARKHAAFWEPVSPRMKQIEGLGSYGSYLGNLTDPIFERARSDPNSVW